MNCTVCGSPLLFDRVVFNCSCGAFVHAYCWDQHVLQAHQPSFELGSANLDGEFIPRESEVEEQVAIAEASEGQDPEEQSPQEQSAGEEIPEGQSSEEQNPEAQGSEEQTTPLLE